MTDHHTVKLVVKPLLSEMLRHDFDIDKIDPHSVLPQRTGEKLSVIHVRDIIVFGYWIVTQIVRLVAKHKQAHKSVGDEIADAKDNQPATLSDPPDAGSQTDSNDPADAKDVVPTQSEDMTATSDYHTPKPVATAFDVLFPAKPDLGE
jgi:hypothetical protein